MRKAGLDFIHDKVDDNVPLDNADDCGFGSIEKIVDEQIWLASNGSEFDWVVCSEDLCLW